MGPFIKSNNNTKKMMVNVVISLLPIIIFGTIKCSIHGMSFLYPLLFIFIAVISSFLFETIYSLIKRKSLRVDLYSIMTGLILSLIVPLNTSLVILIIATFIASFCKMIFGELGKNKVNASLIGYLFIYVLSYFNVIQLDTNILGNSHFSLVFLAFMFLVFTKSVKWRVSLSFLLTVFAINYVAGGALVWYPITEIVSSILLFGAVFVVSDETTTPVTPIGQILFGIFVGIITIVFRYVLPFPELAGVLIMNVFVGVLDKVGAFSRFNFKEALIPFIIVWLLILGLSICLAFNRKIDIADAQTDVSVAQNEDVGSEHIIDLDGIVLSVVVRNGVIVSMTSFSDSEEVNGYISLILDNQDSIDELDEIPQSLKESIIQVLTVK